jgi:hypothetical protein
MHKGPFGIAAAVAVVIMLLLSWLGLAWLGLALI